MCDLGWLELTVSRQAYRKVIKQASMQVSELVGKLVEVTKFTGLLGSGYLMVVGNHQSNAANFSQSKPQF